MDSSHCRSSMCPEGNCEGCRGGKIWCQDQRCEPYCPACVLPDKYDTFVNVVVLIFVVCLVILLIIIVARWGRTSSLFYVPLTRLGCYSAAESGNIETAEGEGYNLPSLQEIFGIQQPSEHLSPYRWQL